MPGKKPGADTKRGVGEALSRAFNGTPEDPPSHVAADAAASEFAALLAQLNDPPPQFRSGASQ